MNPDGTMYGQQVNTQPGMQGGSYGVNVNAGGVGVGVNVNIPNQGTTTTTTTTTTTSGGGYNNGQNPGYNHGNAGNNNGNYGNGGNNGNYNNGNYGGGNNGNYNNGNNGNNNNNSGYVNGNGADASGVCRVPMNPTDFEVAKAVVSSNKFDDTRMSTVKEVLMGNCVSAVQILSLVNLMNFEDNRLELAKYAYTYCLDKSNYFKVTTAFTYESSKEELNNYIKTQR